MKSIPLIIPILTILLATSCKTSRSYVEVDVAPGWGLICKSKLCDSCRVIYTWHNRKIIHSEYYPMNTPDSVIRADSLTEAKWVNFLIRNDKSK